MRRVVVTGRGIVCPLGSGVDHVWGRLTGGDSGLQRIEHFPTDDLPSKVAGIVPHGTEAGELDFDGLFSGADQKKNDRFILYALAASDEAARDAGLQTLSEETLARAGVMIGSGVGGLPRIYDTSVTLHEQSARRVSPFFIPACLINLASGQVSIRHKMRGPNQGAVTACAAGTHAIGDAGRLVKEGYADIMMAGGAEAACFSLGMAGFSAMKALSTKFNDRPQEASRPWDKARDGFVMGEGAGLLVLEELEHAKKRGATIYGEVAGYGLSGDAYHIAAPSGEGAERAMRQALGNAGVAPEDIGYVNAHGTSTPQGDKAELKAVEAVWGDRAGDLMMSSTKSAIGHLLGAAGGVEGVFTLKALESGILPPTLNLTDAEETAVDLLPHKAKKKKVGYALSNSFGFGGTNASLVLKSAADL